mgnify:CR=1 FL=1
MAGKKDYKKTKQYKALKKELEDDLESRGLISEPYKDKVDEYMRLWCWLQMLNDDISERGVFIENQKGTTDNKSLTIATRVSSQMLSIWAALGFKDQAVKAKAAAGGEDDEL